MDKIKTWEERHKPGVNFTWTPTPITNAMQAEITELRAALAARATPAQPVRDSAEPWAYAMMREGRVQGVERFKQQADRWVDAEAVPLAPVGGQPSPSSVGAAIRKLPLPEPEKYKAFADMVLSYWGNDVFARGALAMRSEAAALAEQVQQVWRDDEGVHFSASGACTGDQIEIVNTVCQSIGMQGYFDALVGVWRADGGCQEIPILRAIVAAYKLGKSAPSLPILQERDLKALKRFFECCDDPDSGGHDVSKEAMARLREIGVVESKGFGRHQITAFGDYVLCIETDTVAKFPLKTYAEYETDSKAAHEVKLAAPSIAQDGQKSEADHGN